MATANISTMHLLTRQLPPPATPNCLASNSAMVSLPFRNVAITTSATRSSRNLSAARRRLSFRAPVLASQEAFTSTSADQPTSKASEDFGNGTKAQSPLPTKTVKQAEGSGIGVAVENLAAPAMPSPKAVAKKAVPESLEKIMSENVIPQLRKALQKEAGLTDLNVTFEDNQLKTSFAKGDIPYCFWAFFPDGILEGSRGSSFTSHGSPPSTIEPFLVDEKKISPELLVFWVKKRLFAQKILSTN